VIALTVTGDAEAAARISAERIAAAIVDARASRGVTHVALAGGRTPARTYELLAEQVSDWRDVHLWFGDERCVPLDDPESNHALIARTLLAPLAERSVAPPQVHAVQGAGDGDPTAAAAAYERELRTTVTGEPPVLDIALLGLGEDGHTASLFPDDPVLTERERLCVAVHGTKPPFERVTLTLPVLTAARQITLLTAGPGKAWAVGALLAGPSTRVPASLLADGNVELIVDRAGAPS
jgi:6-phosphogluconolactonase